MRTASVGVLAANRRWGRERAHSPPSGGFFFGDKIVILTYMAEDLKTQIETLEKSMAAPDFWSDKNKAQATIKEIALLKEKVAGIGKYDKGAAIMTIFSGAGGDDAEDFSRILLDMYVKYIESVGWGWSVVHKHENDHGGFRNITLDIAGSGVYGKLKNESGVHRLVRISPFNAKKLRHTSFSLVEVIPKFEKVEEFSIPADDLRVEFARSSGPGGQNVNKRETAVRIVHIPTNISVHVDSQRSQAQNREQAMVILKGKLYKKMEEDRTSKEKGMYISKTTQIEWGNQIRSYVMHPYKMVKDHRTDVEVHDIDKVLEGDIETFLEAEKHL